jgi:hypothetical protein
MASTKIQLYTIDSELKSAKRLGFPATIHLGGFSSKYDNCVIVRWGNSELHYKDESGKISDFKSIINTSRAISLNCDKAKASALLGKVVKTPRLFRDKIPKGITAVVRPETHSAGYGFEVVTGPHELKNGNYATEFIQTDTEYRVWFAGDRTIHGQRVNLDKKSKPEQYPCRSNWGYSYSYDDVVPCDLHQQTLAAAAKIGLELGAADVLYKGGKYYFLELNSAPSVDTKRIKLFFQKNIPIVVKKKFGLDVSIKNR